MDITFKENATLPQCTSCRPIPIHLRGMADEFVKDALKAGCMEKTIEGEACSPAHFVEKYNAEGNIVGVRLVCDLKKLNDSVKRSAITFPTGNDLEQCGTWKPEILQNGPHQWIPSGGVVPGGQKVPQLHPSPREVPILCGSNGFCQLRRLVQLAD